MGSHLNPLATQSSPVHKRRCAERRQRGSIVVMAAIFLSIIVILLSSIDIGYLFYKKRDLQKVADLAALAGAQALTNSAFDCTAAAPAASANAQANGFSDVAPNATAKTITPTCGRWDPQTTPALSTVQTYEAPPDKNFGTPKAGIKLNAVKVIVSENVAGLFGLAPQVVVAQAIATQSQPVAAFSLGTGLLSLCSGSSALLAPLVNGLLGSNVCLSALTYNGLVGAQVPLLNVLTNLNVNAGSIDQVLTTQVTLAQLVNASVQALSPAQLASINVAELGALTSGSLGGTLLTVGNILNLSAADGVSALDTQVNVLDLINVGTLQVANKSNFLDIGATIPGVAGLRLKLIEPPQMAVGGIGAVATSAQLRLNLNVSVPGLLSLPLYVDLAPGKATLTGLQCNAPQSATFSLQTGVAEVCLANGQTDASVPLTSCPNVSIPANQVNVINALGIPVVSLGINASLANPAAPVTLSAPFPSSVTVGSSLSSILGGIIKPGNFVFGGLLSLLAPVLNALGGLLNPILSLVGGFLDSVLSLLGLGVGQSTLKVSSISCGNVKLVY